MFRFNRWVRSKKGLYTIGGVIAALLVIVVAGQMLGWWQSLGLTGSAGVSITLPPVTYPDPQGGYTCFPTCAENDAKFIYIANAGMATFSGEKVVAWIGVPGDKSSFELGIFDGDSGKDSNGNINLNKGNWDDGTTEAVYTMYADPLKDGTGTTVVASWKGNTDNMPNNAWFTQTINNAEAAKAPSRHYFYRLEVTQPVVGKGGNAFKLRSNGYLTTGRSDLVNATISFYGSVITIADRSIVFPQYQSLTNMGQSTYNGDWKFYLYVPKDSKLLSIWDGDFDRGTNIQDPQADSDDPNTAGKPEWAGPFSKDEGRGGKGSPNDDYSTALYLKPPAVQYSLMDPAGNPVYTNENPSGTEEWEQFVLTTDPSYAEPDLVVEKIQPGFYALQVVGLDLHNLAFLRTEKEVCDINSGCGPCVWPGCNATDSCPRTIGYWKNNVKKVYIDGRNNGVQESVETMDWALKAVALESPIFRNGLVASLSDPNATTVAAIANPQPLTKEEANAILQKETAAGNSMLGRALQQNLATWMNLASGKISDNNITVVMKDGAVIFEGTLMEALLEAQNIMLNGGDLQRAKDIADMINNGQFTDTVDVPSNVDGSGNVNCSIYAEALPKDKQPKKYDELPKAPKPEDKNPEPGVMPDVNSCGAIENTYTVENTTNNPFYAIKFNFTGGTEVKDSNFDEFAFTISAEQAAAMTSMQLEAKAGEDEGTATMDTCSFADGMPCGPVQTENHLFAFTFMGATDNGDGTLTLTFQVQNYAASGLSHASFGLPEGVVPSAPASGDYTSKVCP